MSKRRGKLKILLLQSRIALELREKELNSYLKFSKLKDGQIVPYSILNDSLSLDELDLDSFDALIIGGTGNFSVNEIKDKHPEIYGRLNRVVQHFHQKNLPALSACMQFWSVIFGGEVETSQERQEIGTYTIHLTEAAKNDPLFFDMPDHFKAQIGHKDYTSKLPEGAVLLAYSDLCPVHAYRTGDKEYFFQFHPELNKKEIIERLNSSPDYTPDNPEEFNALMTSIEETPESVSLLEKFIDRIVLGNIPSEFNK